MASAIAWCTATAESATASSHIPSESSLTTFKLPTNHSSGFTVYHSASQK